MSQTDALDDVFLHTRSAMEESFRAALNSKLGQHTLVLLEAGGLGRRALAKLRKQGAVVEAFADNYQALWGEEVDGVGVLSPDAAAREFGEQAVFVVCIYTNPSFIAVQLRPLQCRTVLAWELFLGDIGRFAPHASLDSPQSILDNEEAIRTLADLWADDESKLEFMNQLRWRTRLGVELTAPRPAVETYMVDDIYQFGPEEVFIGHGVFDGDTLRAFLGHQNQHFKAYVGFEPNPNNIERLRQSLEGLPPDVTAKIDTYQAATSDVDGTVRFSSVGTMQSSIANEGDTNVRCATLDTALSGVSKSFVKMDIEGAEPLCLLGAQGIIRSGDTAFAVCTYH